MGDYIEIRDKKGSLKRKKCIIADESKNIPQQNQIFRKIGIISD